MNSLQINSPCLYEIYKPIYLTNFVWPLEDEQKERQEKKKQKSSNKKLNNTN
jgi:hypothetical protein